MRTGRIVIVVLAAALLGFGGCAAKPTYRALTVQTAIQNDMLPCRFLGTVMGTAAHSSLPALDGRTKAEYDARDVAAALGATHIVWTEYHGGATPTIKGRAYRCPNIDGPAGEGVRREGGSPADRLR